MADNEIRRLDENGLLYLWGKIKALIPAKTSQLTNDSGYIKASDIVGKLDATGDAKDTTVSFTQAAARTNIATGEKASTLFGKVAKWFADLKTVAFTGAYSDLTGAPSKVSQFTNDSGYQTADQVESAIIAKGYQTSAQVDSAITAKGYQTSAQVDSAITAKGYQTAAQVEAAVKAGVTGVYVPKGSSTFASLPTPAAANVGHVYNVTDAFTTTASFVEGAGKSHPAGTNVVVVQSGSSYLWDVFSGFIDLSGYILASDMVAITNAEIDEICV